jgi:hypothetical protein
MGRIVVAYSVFAPRRYSTGEERYLSHEAIASTRVVIRLFDIVTAHARLPNNGIK